MAPQWIIREFGWTRGNLGINGVVVTSRGFLLTKSKAPVRIETMSEFRVLPLINHVFTPHTLDTL